jgi:hypothetical protein
MIDDIETAKILNLRQKSGQGSTIIKNKGEKNDF